MGLSICTHFVMCCVCMFLGVYAAFCVPLMSKCMHCVYKPSLCVFCVKRSSCTWYADSLIIVIVYFTFELQVVSLYMVHVGLLHMSCTGKRILCLCWMCIF